MRHAIITATSSLIGRALHVTAIAALTTACSQAPPPEPHAVGTAPTVMEEALLAVEREKTLATAKALVDAQEGVAPRPFKEAIAGYEVQREHTRFLQTERDCLMQKRPRCVHLGTRKLDQIQRDLSISERLLAEFHQRILRELNAVADSYRIPFETLNETRLQPEGSKALQVILEALHARTGRCGLVVVVGYGCAIGTDRQTLTVSERRAHVVSTALRTAMPRCSIVSQGRGVAIPEATLAANGLTYEEREAVLRGSREVVVLIPRAPTTPPVAPGDPR